MSSEPLPSLRESVVARHRRVRRSAGRQLRSRLTNAAVGVAAFIATCLALHALLPSPEIEAVSDKLRYFDAHKAEFDTLFIGSSRIYFQVSPQVFDRVAAKDGAPTHSFNFGIGGMHLPESSYVLEQVLATRPPQLRWVFVEYDELQTNWTFQGQTSRRALYWHDWKRTSLLLRKLTGSGTGWIWLPNLRKIRDMALGLKSERETLRLLSFHAGQFQKNFTNVARASDVLDYLARRKKSGPEPKYLGAAADGYIPLFKPMPASRQASYERTLAALRRRTQSRHLSPYAIEGYRQCVARIREVGAVPVLLVTPTLTEFHVAYKPNTGPPAAVLAFNNPVAYPELYRRDVRMDQGHMIKPAAEKFTALVAEKFAQLTRESALH